MADNYKLLTVVVILYYLVVIFFRGFDSYGYYHDDLIYYFLWTNFVYSAWTVINLFKNNPKSSWILFFIFLGLSFNPVLEVEYSDAEKYQFLCVLCLIVILIYNNFWLVIKKIGNKLHKFLMG